MQANEMYVFFKKRAAALAQDITAWRRHMHMHPERSFAEVETTAFIAEKLAEFGYANVRKGFGPVITGLRADLGAGTRRALLRADIDALPVTSTLDAPWSSQTPGVMHACGHDAHAAMLLGAAKMLQEQEAKLPGAVRLLFQPGEEEQKAFGGAPQYGSCHVVADGILDGVDAAFGCHVWGVFPSGVVFVKDGPAMMASARFDITVKGGGTHGATPHLGRDSIVACCDLVNTLQTVISREISPLRSALLSVGTFQAGTAANIIPQEAAISGTIRCALDEDLAFICKRVREVAEKTAEAHRCAAEVKITPGCTAVTNDAHAAAIVREAAGHILGPENVRESELITASEDFSEYSSRVPSALFFLGMADAAKGTGQSQHDPGFRVNDDVLADGAAMLAACAWRYLAGN